MSDAAEPRRIVAGVDGSECSVAALSFAIEEARLRHGVVEAIYAFASPIILGVHPPTDFVEEVERQAREDLEAAVGKATVDDANLPPIVQTVIPEPPVTALLDASRGAELLVLGSRGRGGLREMLLGSVSNQCVHHATCPVTIVRQQHLST